MEKITKEQLQPFDIIFTCDNGVVSRAIKYATNEKYSHCLVFYDKDLILESGWIGVVISGLKRYMKSSTTKVVVRLPLEKEKASTIKDTLVKYVGDNYDYKLFFGHLFRIIFGFLKLDLGAYDSKSRWLCYEVIAKALCKAGIEFDSPIRELTPQKLFDSLKKIEGVKIWTL